MVHYPNGKADIPGFTPANKRPNKKYTAHRGMNLEEDINISNKYYLDHDKAVIHKKPTPVQIVKVDYPKRSAAKIVEAYYRTPSTTDYNGLYKGKYIDFEAKETKVMQFPFKNISDHQIKHLDKCVRHGGIAFVIIAFTSINEAWLVDAAYMVDMYRHHDKRFLSYDEIKDNGHLIPQGYAPRLKYLDVIDDVYLREE